MATDASRTMPFDRRLAAILVVFALLQLPFLSGAFRIDDTNILAIAKQIARAPLDPYGFTFNWTGTARPAFDILANPPLAPALIAVWASLFGWSEVSLHVLTLIFALVALSAFFSIRRDDLGTALMAASPAFFIATQVVMPDMLMLALLLTAVAAAMRYRDDGRFAAVACIAGFLAPISKYNAIILVALLATIAITARQRRAGLAIIAISPIAGLAAWNLFTLWRYGATHLLVVSAERKANLMHTIADLAVAGKRPSAIDPWITAIVLIGLVIVPIGWQLLVRRRFEWILAIATTAVAFFVAIQEFDYPISSAILFAIGVTAGVRAIAFTLALKNPLAIVWLVAVVIFQVITRGVAVRYLLPLLPAMLLVVPRGRRWLAITAIVVSLAVALPLAFAERASANCYRDFVARLPGHHFYFAGHWGFQYYATAAGGTIIDVHQPLTLRPGDVVVIASHAFPSPSGSFPFRGRQARVPCESRFPLRTISCQAAASYNVGEIAGCLRSPIYLPFGFSREPLEEFDVFVIE